MAAFRQFHLGPTMKLAQTDALLIAYEELGSARWLAGHTFPRLSV